MRPIKRRYLRVAIPGLAAYTLSILFSTWLLKSEAGHISTALRTVLALLPTLPIVVVMRAAVRLTRERDELERQIELEAIATSALLVGMGYFSLGLLLVARVFTLPADVVAIWVFPALGIVYGLSKCIAKLRYR